MAFAKLTTARGENLSATPWEAYPRPQLKRNSYVNLNGTWDFAVSPDGAFPAAYDQKILVPFCPESQLSGIEAHFSEGSSLFYRKTLIFPEGFRKDRVLLHIGAADQRTEVYVNQKAVGTHDGGYTAFVFDITDALAEENELVIRVTDDLTDKSMPHGKQSLNRGGMWYTPVSGIWQSVWLESVPEDYVNHLDMQTTLTQAVITVTPALSGTVTLEGREYPLVDGKAVLTPEAPHPWTPEDPHLYTFTLTAGADRIESYFALRTLETKVVEGYPRLCLNGKPYFFHGLLDQGYWPDGIYTPADPQCFDDDILAMKDLGFNMLRKHIKVEPEHFYHACDRLGMVVFQDMVNNDGYEFFRDTVAPTFLGQKRDDKAMHPNPESRAAFLRSMEETVRQLKNHPCICCWTIFNEAWGQFDSSACYEKLKALDSSRFIDSTSGWFRGSRSDVESLHIYFGLWHRMRPSQKPLVLSEFGGFTYSTPDHIFNPDKSYGYGGCKTTQALSQRIEETYRKHVIPAIAKGLCAAVYTQVSDVEDEINGLLTYDRRLCKPVPEIMRSLARDLKI